LDDLDGRTALTLVVVYLRTLEGTFNITTLPGMLYEQGKMRILRASVIARKGVRIVGESEYAV
jgi:hypothetical protein